MGVLVVLSLVLISVYFRESDSGALHGAQGTAASILRPFEVGADRIAQPFRDAYGYFSGLFHAKSQVDGLRREVQKLRQQASQAAQARQENRQLRAAARYVGGPLFPSGYRPLSTAIMAQPASAWDQTVVIDAGKNNGVKKGDAVVTPAGLVGIVTLVYSNEAKVTLLTNESSGAGVSAADQRTGARGIVKHVGGSGGSFTFDHVPPAERVRPGDKVVTAGWRLGKLLPLYPKGIQIGVVATANVRDTDVFQHIRVVPSVDFSKLDTVVVLVQQPRAR
jgi:rod shape-determining protein MreC